MEFNEFKKLEVNKNHELYRLVASFFMEGAKIVFKNNKCFVRKEDETFIEKANIEIYKSPEGEYYLEGKGVCKNKKEGGVVNFSTQSYIRVVV